MSKRWLTEMLSTREPYILIILTPPNHRIFNMRISASNVLTGLFTMIMVSCSSSHSKPQTEVSRENTILDEEQPKYISEIPLPEGFSVLVPKDSSYSKWLNNLSIECDSPVRLYNGSLKYNQNIHYAVLKFDVGKRDLQQCADAAMRIRAEYLFQSGQKQKIKFHFVSGDECKWSDYSKGYRAKVTSNSVIFIKSSNADTGYQSFRNYLDLVYTYAGTASLPQDVKKISVEEIEAGDLFLQTSKPYGHAITVLKVIRNAEGKSKMLLAQSYMPAQSIHILLNGKTPWFEVPSSEESLETPEWIFPANSLNRWR
ncbi:MAG: hypothetical protein GC181_01520 [Bacteroidetes bacterium]|nr:hypothetical protein [Bacteroidota bacterium]